MTENIEIRGGAGEFEAAVIAVVLDRIAAEERAVLTGRFTHRTGLSSWVRAIQPEDPSRPGEVVWPD